MEIKPGVSMVRYVICRNVYFACMHEEIEEIAFNCLDIDDGGRWRCGDRYDDEGKDGEWPVQFRQRCAMTIRRALETKRERSAWRGNLGSLRPSLHGGAHTIIGLSLTAPIPLHIIAFSSNSQQFGEGMQIECKTRLHDIRLLDPKDHELNHRCANCISTRLHTQNYNFLVIYLSALVLSRCPVAQMRPIYPNR